MGSRQSLSMTTKASKSRPSAAELSRRDFLQHATLAGAAAAAGALTSARASEDGGAAAPPAGEPRPMTAQPPSEEITTREEGVTYASCGGDYMTDVLRGLGIEYFAATPGNTFMGLHEAIVNYGMLTQPALRSLLTLHEEASVAMCHGYAKIAGKPMACAMHTTVGLQHGSMAIYNAYADRVPILLLTGCTIDAMRRRDEVEWNHAVSDGPALVRDFTKWDDTPGSLRQFGESAARAYKIAMTPPSGPTLLAVDTYMQEDEIPGGPARRPPVLSIPRFSPPAGEQGAVREAARRLVHADNPVIVADRAARTPEGLARLIELAETLQAPVCDRFNRMNFPWRHPLNQSSQLGTLLSQADVVLALEVGDLFDLLTAVERDGRLRSILPAGATAISLSAVDLNPKGNYQNLQRHAANVDLTIQGDAEATLPSLIEEVKRQLDSGRKSALTARGTALAQQHVAELERARLEASFGWDVSPISVPRLCQEVFHAIRQEDWSLVSDGAFQSHWPQRLWDASRHYQFIGSSGAQGIGYFTPAALGAALANQKYGRLTVAIVGAGDLMFGPGVLWTAAHERIPILYVVHNNRSYHQEIMQMQVIANRRQRGVERMGIACDIRDPNIHYARLAVSLGVYAEGPIERPQDLRPALARAIKVVKGGAPALIDVVSQGR